jgi:hypothetical protein
MNRIDPPCRIYFTYRGSDGLEHASFDVRPYMDARFAEYKLSHVQSSLETTDAQPYLHAEDLKAFSDGGYRFTEDLSDETTWVFTR